MATHDWALDEYLEVDDYAASWGHNCRGPQCATCNTTVCVVHADDEYALADKLFATDCRRTS